MGPALGKNCGEYDFEEGKNGVKAME